ncbi:acyl-coenzyme A diphosphatase FITM2-like [Dreissena polymorpha]|uniref:Fat storage-inducing transmembrane protein n=1 Tax=Dreissena polymorpha TaxID=45954 RepID=A0A9D4DYL2_DREPO|nr:acyl-coenzyme A diphosphatase FITM2-like [Dreissena polymorpha]KAH3770484.1 hypothetical protein DPMN_171771 [Dreissena polymorpha]
MASRSTTHPRNAAQNGNTKKSGKKSLPKPTHVGHFMSILTMSLCKKVLHIDTSVKIGVYLTGVLVGSVFSDIFALPKSYFSDKKNVLNRIFMSFGFGWTFVLLSIYVFLTSFVANCGNLKLVFRKHLPRMFLAAAWWYVMTSTFSYVDSVFGTCSISSLRTKSDCLKAGRAWLGFDLSGHVFLLIHNLLTISEEVKSFKAWIQLDLLLREEDLANKKNLSEKQVSEARNSYKRLTPWIKLCILLLTFWMIFCEFMLIISVVYRFHTMTQKIGAAFVAVGCWFVTYRVLLESKMEFAPGQPGQSVLNYMKLK